MRIRHISVFVAALALLPALGVSHPGRLDKNGCHNDRKRGGYHCHRGSAPAEKKKLRDDSKESTEAKAGVMVSFNVESLKYHKPTCKWALKCTKNCIEISLAEAISRGGVACKVCGGR